MSTAAAAIEFLESKVITAEVAVGSLCRIREPLTMISLFQKYFPKEFARQKLNWLDRDSIVKACSEFMTLVDMRLFPCHDTCGFWDGEEGSMTEIIFFAPFPEWYGDDDDHKTFTPLQEIVLLAVGAIYGKDGEYEPNYESAMRREVDFDLLEQACKRGMLRHLPEAVKFILKITDNTWCDVAQEELDNCSDWPLWSEENIEWLRKGWAEAQKIYARVQALEEWLGTDPARLRKAEHALKIATKQIPPRLRVGIVSSADFVAGISPRALINQVEQWSGPNE